MFISIKHRGVEHSYAPLTGNYLQVHSPVVNLSVHKAVQVYLRKKLPGLSIHPAEIIIIPVSGKVKSEKVKKYERNY